MRKRATAELLFDSETTLRLVDNALDELRASEATLEVPVDPMINGIDRALDLIDQMDVEPAPSTRAAELCAALREELFTIRRYLQSQELFHGHRPTAP